MARTERDRIHFIRASLQSHTDFWDGQRSLMRKYRNAYMTRFYSDGVSIDDSTLRVETADGYAAIESVMGSLFSKYPSVEFGPDITGAGDIELVKTLANDWLKTVRTQIEAASRMALIYTHSFFKLAPRESNTLTSKIALRAVPPWQVILDRDAAAFEDSRFVGHTYYISVDEATERFGAKKWIGSPQRDYFTDYERNTDRNSRSYGDSGGAGELPNEFLYIELVEMYDFLNDELLFWSSHYKNGEELIDRAPIPVSTFDGRQLSNIVPYFFGRTPDRPMEGYSAMSRLYDQIFEKNILRTFWANAVRRDSRQFIYKEGAFDEEALAKITSGVDGAMIPVDADSIGGLIDVVPVVPLSSNHGNYLNYIEQDLAKASLTAGFTRGEASKATATEVSALMQYTASELGKMARDRDGAIEAAVLLYIRMLLPLIEDSDKFVVATPAGAKVVSTAKLDANWSIYITDGGGTPMSEVLQKQQLMQLAPILPSLGVPLSKIKEEIVRLFNLPESFLIEEEAPLAPAVEATALPSDAVATVPTNIGGV